MAARLLSFPEAARTAPPAGDELPAAPTPEIPAGLHLVNALHATAGSIAHNGPPLDMVTQVCAVVAQWEWELAHQTAREGLRSFFRRS
jgi:hypothetical protein